MNNIEIDNNNNNNIVGNVNIVYNNQSVELMGVLSELHFCRPRLFIYSLNIKRVERIFVSRILLIWIRFILLITCKILKLRN